MRRFWSSQLERALTRLLELSPLAQIDQRQSRDPHTGAGEQHDVDLDGNRRAAGIDDRPLERRDRDPRTRAIDQLHHDEQRFTPVGQLRRAVLREARGAHLGERPAKQLQRRHVRVDQRRAIEIDREQGLGRILERGAVAFLALAQRAFDLDPRAALGILAQRALDRRDRSASADPSR